MKVKMLQDYRTQTGRYLACGEILIVGGELESRLLALGVAEKYTEPQPAASTLHPSRAKFVSLVGKLNPAADNYAAEVACLSQEHEKRMQLIGGLTSRINQHEKQLTLGLIQEARAGQLLDAIGTAVTRFVVDNY